MHVVEKSVKFLPEELVDKSIKDANGTVCAGLMILSDLEGLTFTSYNGIVKVNSNPGKYFLFLSPDERVIETYKTGYAALKIILNEYDVKLTSGQTWQLKVTGEKQLETIPINIIAFPEGSTVIIDSVKKGVSTSFLVPVGKHTLRLEKEGYKSIEKTITVSPTTTLFSFTLQEIEPLPVTFTSSPNGASIIIDNALKGETDKAIFLYPGNYKLKLTLSGYLDIEQNIDIKEDIKNKFSFTLTKNSGTLSLLLMPKDAQVLINKEKYDKTASVELAPGKYKVEIQKDGYYDTTETVEIVLGKTVTKTYSLRQKTGKLQFTVQPLEAEITLKKDGNTYQSWQGTKLIKDIPVGEYDIECCADGYQTVKKKITITENKTTPADISLNKGSDVPRTGSACIGVPTVKYKGKTYNTVQIGSQCWFKENLDIGTMITGNSIQTENGVIEKYCYNDKPANCTKYGGLYQWDEAMQYKTTKGTQGICPSSWHIPTKAEVQILGTTVNNDGNALKAVGQGTGDGAGRNTSGFSALFSGYQTRSGIFSAVGNTTFFWSSTEYNATSAIYLYLYYNDNTIYFIYSDKVEGYSVRCLKD